MAKRRAIELADSMIGKISEEYGLKMEELCELRAESEDLFQAVFNGYNLGYLRGVKATKAKKKNRK
ncbi:hypothetical protein [Enterocloster lavalensis]|uniref:hypothetical protein n=1 Tax=Enterocloster lavalensis TaxID=460384 RepID=UPI0034A29416